MEIIYKKIEELKLYANNPRRNEAAVQYVANSIKEFGFKNPIIIDKNGEIIAGHTRYKAALQRGMEKVPCIIADDLTKKQIKAYRLADNKTAEMAGWDFELLDNELFELEDDFDMGDFGFELNDIIDWSTVDEISKDNYEKPESEKLRCPLCGGIDEKIRFVKVNE